MITKFKAFFTRTLGLTLTTVLIASGFIALAPTAAYADTVDFPTTINISLVTTTATTAKISVNLDKDLEDSSSILRLYRKDNPITVETKSSGKNLEFTVPLPTDSISNQYYASVGALRSEPLTIYSSTIEWEAKLDTVDDKTVFEANEPTPTLTWNLNKPLNDSGKALYLIDKVTNNIETSFTSGTQGSWNTINFITEATKRYVAVVADVTVSATNLTDLNNIEVTSNDILIEKKTWEISLETDKDIYAPDAPPTLTWKTNQIANSTEHQTNLRIYITDSSTGEILNKINPDIDQKVGNYVVPFVNEYTDYIAYVAPDSVTAMNITDLSSIQASSNTVKTQLEAWDLKFTIDQAEFSVDQQNPKIFWETNHLIDGTSNLYALYVADKDTGEIFYTSNSTFLSDSGEVFVPRFYDNAPRKYIGYIAAGSDPAMIPTNVSQLQNIQATSNTVFTNIIDWEIIAGKNANGSSVTWSTNQTIDSSTSIYGIFLVDNETGNIISSSEAGNSGTFPALNKKSSYQVYVAEKSNAPQTSADLLGIQAISNTIKLNTSIWSVKLETEELRINSDVTPEFSWQTNIDIGGANSSYAAYLVHVESGEILNSYAGNPWEASNTGMFSGMAFTYLDSNQATYKVYIASNENEPYYLSELSDIQASSAEVKIIEVPWRINIGLEKSVFSSSDVASKLTWNTNQSLEYNDKIIYIAEAKTGKIIRTIRYTDHPYPTDTGTLLMGFKSGGTQYYKAYVTTQPGIEPTNISQINVDAESNVVSLTRMPWNIEITNVSIDSEQEWDGDIYISYEWKTNQKAVGKNNYYKTYVFIDGKRTYAEQNDSEFTGGRQDWVSKGENHTVIAYIAKNELNGPRVMTPEALTEIQAVSNVYNTGILSEELIAERYKGGSNPSEADCNQQCYGDPVNSLNGEFFENYTDLNIQDNIPFNFSRSYSTSSLGNNGAFGNGWTFNYNMSIQPEDSSEALSTTDRIKIIQENGSVTNFTKTISAGKEIFSSNQSTQATFSYESTTNKFHFTRKNNITYIFNGTTGKLETIKDLNDNTLIFDYTLDYLTKVKSNTGKEINLTWINNKIQSVTDGTRTVNYSYSTQGDLEIVDLPDTVGNKQYIYDTDHRITGVIHQNGASYHNSYDTEGRVSIQTNPFGQDTLFSYSENETIITLPDGTINKELYNINGQLIQTIYALGTPDEARYQYEYDSFTGQKSKEIDPLGNETKYQYDWKGNTLNVTNALGYTTSFTYNSFNRVVETINAVGDVAVNEYNNAGNLVKTTSFEGNITTYEVNTNGTNNSITSPNDYINSINKKISFGYDLNGYLNSTTNPEGGTLGITNNTLGNPLTVTDPLNNTTAYTYNLQNQLVETLAPNGATTEAVYDNAGQVTKTVDELGNETITTYNLMGNLLTKTTPLGTVTYDYDNMQRVIKVINVNGGETNYEYDKLGRVIKTTDPLGNETNTSYTKHSLVASAIDSRGNTTTYEYDAVGNTTKIKDALNNESAAVYDSLNRLISTTSASGYTETYTYDDDNNLLSATKAGLETTSYEYDNNANLVKTIYPDSSTEERTYNSDNELLTIKDRDGKTTTYQYNAGGQVTKTIRPDSTEIVYSYTNMGELDSISYDNWATMDTEFVYNIAGQITSEYKNGVETTYSYDAIGNLTKRGPPTGAKVEYDYNIYGQVKETQYPNGLALNYDYDLNGNLKKVKKNNSVLAEYIYDANGNNTRINYGNGTYEENSYDELNRLEKFTVNNDNQLYKKELELNNVGLIVGNKTTNNNTITEDKTYTYTATQRLENVTDTVTSQNNAYSYDTSHNLLSSQLGTNTFTANGKLTTTQKQNTSLAYSYDSRGNRTNKTVTNNASSTIEQTVSYSWTPDNKLSNFTSTNLNNSALNRDIDYSYDANGLLVGKTNNLLNYTEDFTWDALTSIPTLLEDSDNSYIYGTGSAPFAQINKNTDEITYLHGDERGSVILATDDSGIKEWSRSYDEYGSVYTQTPSTGVVTPFAYAGEYLDEDSDLYNLRARWYEPETASFINVDPALSSTGEAYSYASGNPLTFTDPLGLWSHQNAWNSTIGFFDGITGIPFASSIVNSIIPGSIQTCSPEYEIANGAGTAISYAIPGLGPIKSVVLLSSIAAKVGLTLAAKEVIQFASIVAVPAIIKKATTPRWKVGDWIGQSINGRDPSWGVIRSRYWKNEAQIAKTNFGRHTPNQLDRNNAVAGHIDKNETKFWTKAQIQRMETGRAPQRIHPNGFLESMELSHETTPQRKSKNIFDKVDVIQRWPEEHALVDPYRKLGSKYN